MLEFLVGTGALLLVIGAVYAVSYIIAKLWNYIFEDSKRFSSTTVEDTMLAVVCIFGLSFFSVLILTALGRAILN